MGFTYQGYEYHYRKNAQGDILGVYSGDGLHATYSYDAWGNCLATDESGTGISNVNPFRYRGYYYDTETKLYYLLNRYYDPEIGRFISPDDIRYLNPETIGGLNLYSYCLDNPVMGRQKIIYSSNGIDFSVYIIINNSSNQIASNKENSLGSHFVYGLVNTDIIDNCPTWFYAYGFYTKGDLNLGYTKESGFSLGNIEVGITSFGFISPKLFSQLSVNSIVNPNIFVDVGVFTANASIGLGVSGTASILSGSIGVTLGDSITVSVTGYIGVGFVFDLSHGIKFGGGVGLVGVINLEFDWIELF